MTAERTRIIEPIRISANIPRATRDILEHYAAEKRCTITAALVEIISKFDENRRNKADA